MSRDITRWIRTWALNLGQRPPVGTRHGSSLLGPLFGWTRLDRTRCPSQSWCASAAPASESQTDFESEVRAGLRLVNEEDAAGALKSTSPPCEGATCRG